MLMRSIAPTIIEKGQTVSNILTTEHLSWNSGQVTLSTAWKVDMGNLPQPPPKIFKLYRSTAIKDIYKSLHFTFKS